MGSIKPYLEMSNNSKQQKNNNPDSNLFFHIVALVVIFTVVALMIYISHFGKAPFSDSTQDWAAFITYSTGVAGLVLGVSSTYLIYITYKSSVENSKETAKLAEESIKNARLQQFEGAFFQLLNNRLEIIKVTEDESNYSTGLKAFQITANSIESAIQKIGFKPETFNGTTIEIFVYNDMTFEMLMERINQALEVNYVYYIPYSQYIYQTIEYISSSNVENKEKYFNLLKASLTIFEIKILFYLGLSNYTKDLHEILDSNSILSNFYVEIYSIAYNLSQLYPKTTFTHINAEISEVMRVDDYLSGV